jgi:hypothetical protein
MLRTTSSATRASAHVASAAESAKQFDDRNVDGSERSVSPADETDDKSGSVHRRRHSAGDRNLDDAWHLRRQSQEVSRRNASWASAGTGDRYGDFEQRGSGHSEACRLASVVDASPNPDEFVRKHQPAQRRPDRTVRSSEVSAPHERPDWSSANQLADRRSGRARRCLHAGNDNRNPEQKATRFLAPPQGRQAETQRPAFRRASGRPGEAGRWTSGTYRTQRMG